MTEATLIHAFMVDVDCVVFDGRPSDGEGFILSSRPSITCTFRLPLGNCNACRGLPDLALASRASVIHVNKADVSMGEEKEFMLVGAAVEILPMLAKKIAAVLAG